MLYKEEDESNVVYMPIYGTLNIWSKKQGQLGRVYPGFTVGEEVLVDKNYVCRIDNCFAEVETSLICIEKE